jgi:hypothetical protein
MTLLFLISWASLTILLTSLFFCLITLSRVIVRGTTKPHKLVQPGSTPGPATNSPVNSGTLKTGEGFLVNFPSSVYSSSKASQGSGCGVEPEPEKLAVTSDSVAGSSPAPSPRRYRPYQFYRNCPVCDNYVERTAEHCPMCNYEF